MSKRKVETQSTRTNSKFDSIARKKDSYAYKQYNFDSDSAENWTISSIKKFDVNMSPEGNSKYKEKEE